MRSHPKYLSDSIHPQVQHKSRKVAIRRNDDSVTPVVAVVTAPPVGETAASATVPPVAETAPHVTAAPVVTTATRVNVPRLAVTVHPVAATVPNVAATAPNDVSAEPTRATTGGVICPHCGKTSKNKNSLRAHNNRSHKGRRPNDLID
jgi:hypothetical protein